MSTLRLVRWIYPQNTGCGFTFVPRLGTTNSDIEQYFLQLATKLKMFDVTINHNLPYLLHGYLKEWIHRVQKLQLHVIYRYMNEIERILNLLNDVPEGALTQRLRNDIQIELNTIVNDLTQNLEDLQTKARFINDLAGQNFRYYNAGRCSFRETDDAETLERTLIQDSNNDRILCSNDILNSNNKSQLKILLHKLVEERKANPNLRLIYADFSYSSFKLSEIMILPNRKHTRKQSLFRPLPKRQTGSLSSSQQNEDVINILLLGETGVGKSTFINAFVNYLTFDTLEHAQSNPPLVVIPVSFLITTGDNFHEHTVKFGDSDALHNEDFDHSGQSVTQHCKSYVFHLHHNGGRKVRIIDTPGFGDTRGVVQDDRNMEGILDYISRLTHLNAVCFLLKPNESRLNVSFQTSLTQLFDLLGPTAHQNILFCFTNARSTFYAPGNTATLLRAMINSRASPDIPFKNENTFCFDNESFRYLVALRSGIQFDDEEKQEYEVSWSTSVNESNRLLTYVRTQLIGYPLHNGRQSVRHAQMKIGQMIRPMLETMRNLLRNTILWDMDSSRSFIKLCPQALQRPSAFCTSCQRDPFQLCGFWILPEDAHEFRSKFCTCTCAPSQHVSADYILAYDMVNSSSNDEKAQLQDFLEQLCAASAEFAHFLMTTARSTKEDSFLNGFMRMIREEEQICTDHQSNHLNVRLVQELQNLIVRYKEQMARKTQSHDKNTNLQLIYERLTTIENHPLIREQIAAIHQHREKYRDEHLEYDINKNSTQRKIYLSTEC